MLGDLVASGHADVAVADSAEADKIKLEAPMDESSTADLAVAAIAAAIVAIIAATAEGCIMNCTGDEGGRVAGREGGRGAISSTNSCSTSVRGCPLAIFMTSPCRRLAKLCLFCLGRAEGRHLSAAPVVIVIVTTS